MNWCAFGTIGSLGHLLRWKRDRNVAQPKNATLQKHPTFGLPTACDAGCWEAFFLARVTRRTAMSLLNGAIILSSVG